MFSLLIKIIFILFYIRVNDDDEVLLAIFSFFFQRFFQFIGSEIKIKIKIKTEDFPKDFIIINFNWSLALKIFKFSDHFSIWT